jgi:hydroxylysine kinase
MAMAMIVDDTVLATPTPIHSLEAAAVIAARFGVAGAASVLSSERDSNFRISADDGREYLLKITNPAEDPAVTNFQTEALLWLSRTDPSLPAPRPLRAPTGEYELHLATAGGPDQIARLLTYLPGLQLQHVNATPALRRNIGMTAARLDRALSGFSHPMSGYRLAWDLKHASELRGYLSFIDDRDRRRLAGLALSRYERVQPVIADLRWQVIHNDINRHNMLCATKDSIEIAGIIDFGDLVRAPMINDLAIACSYHTEADSWGAAAEIASGYNAALPLTPLELRLLPDLIATRLAMTVLITGWRAVKYPENRDYILRNSHQAWGGLEHLRAVGLRSVQRQFDEALA